MGEAIRRAAGIGLVWSALWIAVATVVGLVIAIVQPDSIDPGEEWMMLVIFGPMGFFSGVAFTMLWAIRGGRQAVSELSFVETAVWGFVACAIVQVAYLGHGDQGLAANIKMALLFSGAGGVIAMAWLAMARQRRSNRKSHTRS